MLYVAILLIVIIMIVILFFIGYQKIKDLNKNIDICNSDIEEIIDKKKNLINDIIKSLNSKKLKNIFNYKEELDIFSKEKLLFDTKWEINKYLNGKKKINDKEVFVLLKDIDCLDEDLEGLKNYYNANANRYNAIYNKKFFNIIYKIMKFKEKEVFELRKLEDYDILKD